jgi:signal transduction histidine kinase
LESTLASLKNSLPFRLLQRLIAWLDGFVTRFIPPKCRADPNETRRARLIAHFGLQGAVFGTAYAIFYYYIGHIRGAEVVVVCSLLFAATPWFLRRSGALHLTGHLLVGTMAAGFTQLTLIEGGIHSHAVSWLASVPLCALLILGVWPAAIWAAVCFVAGGLIALLTLIGWDLAPLYDPRWHDVVDAAGNLGIIAFLFILGLVFEVSRATAFDHMQASLDLLATSNEELAHLNNEKTEFLGMAAHDLRNPLSAVIGFADLLQMESSPKISKRGSQIAQAGRRMLELINDLLDANAIEEGRYAAHVEPADLRTLVATSIQHNHTSAERKQTTLELQQGPPTWALADRKATLQILDNLLSNALKYSPAGSRIILTLRRDGDWTEFAIQDQGPGISEADQQKLFQKHTKLSARPTGGESSVGLGLAIVKRLAEAMGGSVACRSQLGAGATFLFRLRGHTPATASVSPFTTAPLPGEPALHPGDRAA